MTKLNILLVDDHPENLLALQAVLESPDYRLVKAKDGMEALKLLLKEEFHLILLDVFMPGLNGFETAAMIRERAKTRQIPIIFITAVNKSDADAARGYSLGAIDYIIKPFDPDILRSKVAALIALSYQGSDQAQNIESIREGEREAKEKVAFLEKASEARYRNLANAIPHILWIAGSDGRVDFFNQQWFSYTGLTFEESEGWGWKKVIHPEDLQPYLDRWDKIHGAPAVFEIQCRLKRAGGVYRWHLVRALPEKENEKTVSWLATATDIDAQKRSEQVLKQKTIEAEEGIRVKSEFVSNVSHELRTPLNAIFGYTSFWLEEAFGPVHENQKTAVEGVHRNAAELLNLINNLLDLSKVEFGTMQIVTETVDLKRLLPEAIEGIQVLMAGKGISLEWKVQEELHPIQSDPMKVRQIFINLFSNAIKFTESGSITVSAFNVEGGIQFSVRDTGIGMRPEDLSSIFDPYKQVDDMVRRKMGGSGLGLTIVKNALRMLHGTIDVQSEFGRGSTFTVFLPKAPPKR
jgi:two-component system, sensor histidine kinase